MTVDTERLRKTSRSHLAGGVGPVLRMVADEVDTLRAELDRAKKVIEKLKPLAGRYLMAREAWSCCEGCVKTWLLRELSTEQQTRVADAVVRVVDEQE